MKFRIVEIKESLCRPRYKPQYKTFIFWNNISDTFFARSIFNKIEFLKLNPNCVNTMLKAENIIEDYKKIFKRFGIIRNNT